VHTAAQDRLGFAPLCGFANEVSEVRFQG
jgi:hypothetical protein